MKFKNGLWLLGENIVENSIKEVYKYEVKGDNLYLYCPFYDIHHRGNTLGGMLTIKLGFSGNDVTFSVFHFDSDEKDSNFFTNNMTGKFDVKEEYGKIIVNFADSEMVIVKKGAEITFRNKNEETIKFPTNTFIYYQNKLTRKNYISFSTNLGVNENLYGFGERFTNFIKNGQTIKIWNEDGGTSTEQAYKNVPFYVSSKGYGLFVNNRGPVEYEVGTEFVSRMQCSINSESIEFVIFNNNDVKDTLSDYTNLTGRAPKVPVWSYGLWLSTSFITDYNDKTVMEFIDGMIDRDIPFDVFHFDCFWMKEYEWMNFEWDKETFPNPKKLISNIHEKGKKVCVWINPYVAFKSSLYAECAKNGYFIKKENNRDWQGDKWQAGMAIIDFTNPEARSWYKKKLIEQMELGVDTFKTDFGERIPIPSDFYECTEVSFFDGSTPENMHNYYSYLYEEVVFEALEEFYGEGQACIFARSATTGAQKFPVHWGGDCLPTYESMAESLRGGLSLGLSGFAYWSHDIGGFESGCEPDIYKRWTQFGMFSSHSRYHGSFEYKVPWLYGEEASEVTKKFAKLKNTLMPYIRNLETDVINAGLPMLRPMFLEFPKDRVTYSLDTQYMFGNKILVAPIFNDKGNCDYYLPNGTRWLNIINYEIKEGGQYYSENFDYFNMPALIKEDTCLELSTFEDAAKFEVDAVKLLCFAVVSEHIINVIHKGKEVKIIVSKNSYSCDAEDLSIEIVRIA